MKKISKRFGDAQHDTYHIVPKDSPEDKIRAIFSYNVLLGYCAYCGRGNYLIPCHSVPCELYGCTVLLCKWCTGKVSEILHLLMPRDALQTDALHPFPWPEVEDCVYEITSRV